MSRLLAFLFLCGSLQATEVCVLAYKVEGGVRGESRGSGVILSRKGDVYSIATARHVIRDATQIFVGTKTRWVEIKSLHALQKHDDDFAVLKVVLPDEFKPAKVSETEAKAGESIRWSGYSGGTKHEAMTGTVKAVGDIAEASCDVRCKPGQSGGGVYRNGELVGIVNGYNTETGELIYVPVCHIRRRCHHEWHWFFGLGPLPPPAYQRPQPMPQPAQPDAAPPPPVEKPQQPQADYSGEIESLKAEIARLQSQRIPVEILNPDGSVHDKATYKIGSPIQLKLSPKK